MLTYVLRRVGSLMIVLAIASVIVFSLVRLLPGDPAMLIAGDNASPEQIEAIRIRLGLHRPIVEQYLIWISSVIRGDLGHSFVNGIEVLELIRQRLPATVELAVAGLLLALVFGVLTGVIAGLRNNGIVDRAVSLLNVIALGVPSFSLGLLLLITFGLNLGWFPLSGHVPFLSDPGAALRHLALPAITLGFLLMPQISLLVRDGILTQLEQDHVRTARAMGLPSWTITRSNLLRNAFIPVLTMLGLITGNLLSGAVVVEAVFGWPGLGSLALGAVLGNDLPTVQAIVLLAVTIFVTVNLITDILHARLDPRVLKEGV